MKKLWLIPVFAVLVGLGIWFVGDQNCRYRAQQAVVDTHQSDIQMCRMQLGIDGPEFHFRTLMMACVHEVTIGADKHGGNRRDLFNKAWAQCMPEMNTCARALR